MYDYIWSFNRLCTAIFIYSPLYYYSKQKVCFHLLFDVYPSVILQHCQRRIKQEKELLDKKVEWLTEELKNKTEELLTTHRDKGSEILELQSNLKNGKEQVSSVTTHVSSTNIVVLCHKGRKMAFISPIWLHKMLRKCQISNLLCFLF